MMKDVEYFSRDGIPGRYFTCEHYGTMTDKFCAESHEKSKTKEYIECGRRYFCRYCVIGARHSSGEDAAPSNVFGSKMCARCERPTNRLVNSRICVSCYNREREAIINKNGKGNPPKMKRSYHKINLLVIKKGGISVQRFDRVVSMKEARLSVAMKEKETVFFGEI